MLKHKHSPASKVSHCYSWVISSCISTSWLTHFKGELQCQMLFIQIQFVSSLRKPVFYSCRSISSSCFFLFLCIIAVANSKENKKKKQQHWPGNNYLTVWSMFVCFWKCVHICFCAFACAIYECGSWQFTSLGSVLIRRSQCYLSVLAAISLSLRNPQITASSHEWDPSCFLHHNLKYWLKNSTVMRYSHCKQIKEGAQRVWRTFRCWWERTVIWLHIDWGYWWVKVKYATGEKKENKKSNGRAQKSLRE